MEKRIEVSTTAGEAQQALAAALRVLVREFPTHRGIRLSLAITMDGTVPARRKGFALIKLMERMRLALGVKNQRDMATKLGIDQATVCRLGHGRGLSKKTIARITATGNVSEELLKELNELL